jgi:L-alanine-DL-glutamate epimerase-like enolase superfamily enzyme
MAHAAELDILWLDEPVSCDNLAGLREVRDRVDAHVTAGEYCPDLRYYQCICAADALDCVQVDVSRWGDQRMASHCCSRGGHGLEFSGHCAPHLSVHVAAANPTFCHMEWFHGHVAEKERSFEGCLDPDGGVLTPDAAVATD